MTGEHVNEGAAAPSGRPASRETPGLTDSRALARWIAIVLLATLAGLAAWLGGEATYQHFKPSEESSSQRFEFSALNRELSLSSTRNSAVAYGLLGACIGLCLGLAPDRPRRGLAGRFAAMLLGAIAGAAAGVIGSYLVIPLHFEYKDPSGGDIGQSVLVHGAIWGLVGLGAGMAFGLSRPRPAIRDVLRTAAGGLIGALVGTLVYELIGGLAFPLARTTDAISISPSTRLIACLAVSLGAIIGALAARPSPPE
jgi:hypothetical protein